jgi:hypothetical protein
VLPRNTTLGVLMECPVVTIVYHLVRHGAVRHRPRPLLCHSARAATILEALLSDPRYSPGPHVAMFALVHSSSSENSRIPDTMSSEEMLLFH